MDSKLLSEGGWKPVLAKAKELKNKDNGLQKALATFEKTPEDKHDECLKAVGSVFKLATDFKNDKTVKPLADVVKYLTSVINAATAAQKEINQAKTAAAAALKAKLEADKKAAAADKKAEAEGDEEEDEEASGDTFKKLATALKNVRTAKDPYYFLVCDAKPYGLIVSKKNITKSANHKKELSTIAGGSTRAPKFGTCWFDSGKYVFDMDKPPSGMARILQKWLKENLGLVVKVMVGTESGDDETVGQESVVAGADAPIDPGSPLGKAPEAWNSTRSSIKAGIDQLKAAVRKEFAAEGKDIIAEIDKNMSKLDGVLGKLDDRLSTALNKARAAKDAAARKSELASAKGIVADYLKYVGSEKLIEHIDANPFGVKVDLKKNLVNSLGAISKAIG